MPRMADATATEGPRGDRPTQEDDRDARMLIRDLLSALEGMPLQGHAALAASRAREFMETAPPSDDAGLPPIEAPRNGETDPEWRAIRRSIDLFVGRVPTVGKHRALNTAHIAETVARLDAGGDHAAADTIVWQCWHRALDRERERFLLEDAREQMVAIREGQP